MILGTAGVPPASVCMHLSASGTLSVPAMITLHLHSSHFASILHTVIEQ